MMARAAWLPQRMVSDATLASVRVEPQDHDQIMIGGSGGEARAPVCLSFNQRWTDRLIAKRGLMHKDAAFGQPLEVIHFPLASGSDALVLSRFVHQVVDLDLCMAKAVVVELKGDHVPNRSILGVLNMAVGRLHKRHMLTVVLSPNRAMPTRSQRATFPNIGLARFAESEVDAALLLLNDAWRLE